MTTEPLGTGPLPPADKRILYVGPSLEHFRDLVAGLAEAARCTPIMEGRRAVLPCRELGVELVAVTSVEEAARSLHRSYVNLAILDARGSRSERGVEPSDPSAGIQLLDLIEAEHGPESRYPAHRILALVSGTEYDPVDRIVAAFGARHVGRVLRDATEGPRTDGPVSPGRSPEFFALLLQESLRLMTQRRARKMALCASGGGITGIYFEMGVLKCLGDCLDRPIPEVFDMFFGISAGAVVTGFLANGYGVDECMGALAGVPGLRLPPSTLSLFRWRHLDLAGYARRLALVLRDTGAAVLGHVRGRRRLTLESVAIEYGDLLGPPFHPRGYEAMLRRVFTTNGATNDFRKLARPLYVGATDQDRKVHVLFGGPGHDDVPMSEAIAASLSINPAFAPATIRGRYFEDGAVTRTSNLSEAIARGADLVLVIDPFVPFVSPIPGYNSRRGFLYNIDQDIRTSSFTRFEGIRDLVLPRHPEVSCYTFLPRNRLRRLLSSNPMDHRTHLVVWRGAYLSTLGRLQRLRYRLAGDLRAHGFVLDTTRAEAVAARLREVRTPALGDFYPDGKFDPGVAHSAPRPASRAPGPLAAGVAAHA